MIEMNRRSTKAVSGNDLILHYRQEGDIYRLVHYVLHGDGNHAPVYVGGKGISLYPKIFARSLRLSHLTSCTRDEEAFHKSAKLPIGMEITIFTEDSSAYTAYFRKPTDT